MGDLPVSIPHDQHSGTVGNTSAPGATVVPRGPYNYLDYRARSWWEMQSTIPKGSIPGGWIGEGNPYVLPGATQRGGVREIPYTSPGTQGGVSIDKAQKVPPGSLSVTGEMAAWADAPPAVDLSGMSDAEIRKWAEEHGYEPDKVFKDVRQWEEAMSQMQQGQGEEATPTPEPPPPPTAEVTQQVVAWSKPEAVPDGKEVFLDPGKTFDILGEYSQENEDGTTTTWLWVAYTDENGEQQQGWVYKDPDRMAVGEGEAPELTDEDVEKIKAGQPLESDAEQPGEGEEIVTPDAEQETINPDQLSPGYTDRQGKIERKMPSIIFGEDLPIPAETIKAWLLETLPYVDFNLSAVYGIKEIVLLPDELDRQGWVAGNRRSAKGLGAEIGLARNLWQNAEAFHALPMSGEEWRKAYTALLIYKEAVQWTVGRGDEDVGETAGYTEMGIRARQLADVEEQVGNLEVADRLRLLAEQAEGRVATKNWTDAWQY